MWKCVYCGKESESPFDFVPALKLKGLKCFMNGNCNLEEPDSDSKVKVTFV
jgi:hypothetical protein